MIGKHNYFLRFDIHITCLLQTNYKMLFLLFLSKKDNPPLIGVYGDMFEEELLMFFHFQMMSRIE